MAQNKDTVQLKSGCFRSSPGTIDRLTIKGFESLAGLHRFPLTPLNILIGENGSGKSNFVSFLICWARCKQE